MNHINKFSKACLVGLLAATTLTGCAGYSMPQAKPYESKQAVPTSETDTKIFLTTKVNDVIASTSGISSLIVLYQEDSITPTPESKASLLSGIKDCRATVDKNIKYLTSFTPAPVFEEKRNAIVGTLEGFNSVLEGIDKALKDNDFKALKEYTNQYNSAISALQTASM